jgi:hypothetical protein
VSVFCRHRIHGLTIASDLPLPGVPRAAGSVHVAITRRIDPLERGQAPFHRWRDGRRTWLAMARDGGGYRLRFPALAEFFVSRDGSRIEHAAAPDLPAGTLRHLLLNQVLPLALARQGRTVLHASAVHVPRLGTVAFAGPSGSGKSTLAAALATLGGAIVTDDALVLGEKGRRDTVMPAYPELRMWRASATALCATNDLRGPVAHYSPKARLGPGVVSFHGRAARLRAVFLLGPRHAGAHPIRVSAVPGAAALVALMRCAYVLDVEDRAELARGFDGLSELVDLVPVRRLAVRNDRRRLRDAAAAVLATFREVAPAAGPGSSTRGRRVEPGAIGAKFPNGL